MSWALQGGEIEKLDHEEELDYLEIRLQKLESKEYAVRRKSAEALAPYIAENRLIDEVRERFAVQPPHPAEVLADAILGPESERNACQSMCQSLAHMGPAAAPYASAAVAVLMAHVDDELRWEAARCLGYLGPGAAKDAAAAMGKQLDPDNENNILVRYTTAKSLGLLGPGAAKGAAAALAKALEDKDRDVQNASAKALALIGPDAAKKADKALTKAMLEGTFELRRLAVKALIAMGAAAAGEAAYPAARVLARMKPCCPGKFHAMTPMRKRQPQVCDQCHAIGPFAQGTDFTCSGGCKWDICTECYGKLQHEDVELQRLAADALYAMGPEAVKMCQVYLARSLGDADEEVREKVQKALDMAGCRVAVQGSMALYDGKSCPCGMPNCLLCQKSAEVQGMGLLEAEQLDAMLEDEQPSAILEEEEEKAPSDGGPEETLKEDPLADLEEFDDYAAYVAAQAKQAKHEDYVAARPVEEGSEEPPSETEDEPEDDVCAPPVVEEVVPELPELPKLEVRVATPELPKPEPREATPELPQPELLQPEAVEPESPIEVRRDPWGPAEQVSRSRKPYPSLAVHTDIDHAGKTKQPVAPASPASEPAEQDDEDLYEAD